MSPGLLDAKGGETKHDASVTSVSLDQGAARHMRTVRGTLRATCGRHCRLRATSTRSLPPPPLTSAHGCVRPRGRRPAPPSALTAPCPHRTPPRNDPRGTRMARPRTARTPHPQVHKGELDHGLVKGWISRLLKERGGDMYRMKGVLHLAHAEQRFVYHAVHMTFSGSFDEPWRESLPRDSLPTHTLPGRLRHAPEEQPRLKACTHRGHRRRLVRKGCAGNAARAARLRAPRLRTLPAGATMSRARARWSSSARTWTARSWPPPSTDASPRPRTWRGGRGRSASQLVGSVSSHLPLCIGGQGGGAPLRRRRASRVPHRARHVVAGRGARAQLQGRVDAAGVRVAVPGGAP